MVSAGIPLHQTLHFLGQQEVKPQLFDFYQTTLRRLESGSTFSESLKAGPQNVGTLNIALIRIAEQTGALERVLSKIADYEERSNRVKKRIASQLVYPIFLALFAVFAVVVLPGYCLSGIPSILENEGAELPVLSRAFFWFSGVTRSSIFWILSVCAAIVLAYLLRETWRNDSARGRILGFLEAMPVASNLVQNWRLAFFSDCLALQLSVGMSPLQAFPLASLALDDPRLREYTKGMVQALEQGDSISESLRHWPNLPQTFLSMAEVGEVSGQWPRMLRKLAEYHHQQLEHAVDDMVTLLEPMALSFMGLVFGFMIVATLSPMLKLIEGLS